MLQQDLLRVLDAAWSRFKSGVSKRPRMKGRRRGWAAMGLEARECSITPSSVVFPKLGNLRACGYDEIPGTPKHVSITKEVDQWFLSIACVVHEAIPQPPTGDPIGLDFGVVNTVADSSGVVIRNPKHKLNYEPKLRSARAVATRRAPKAGEPPSKNFLKALQKVAKIQRKIRRKRANLQHQITTKYASGHRVVVIEDLQVAKMVGPDHDTGRDSPYTLPRRTRKAVLDVGWHAMRVQLQYKCERFGSELVAVDAAWTSLTCPACKHVSRDNRPTRDEFLCSACGYSKAADVAAAENILAKADFGSSTDREP